jgi:hypothetical protein
MTRLSQPEFNSVPIQQSDQRSDQLIVVETPSGLEIVRQNVVLCIICPPSTPYIVL